MATVIAVRQRRGSGSSGTYYLDDIGKTRDVCNRCARVVYQVEKLGPINGVIFHKACFRCRVCAQYLTLNTFKQNQTDTTDKEIYCKKHVPRSDGFTLDGNCLGIRSALNAQRKLTADKQYTYDKYLRGPDHGRTSAMDQHALSIQGPIWASGVRKESSETPSFPQFGTEAIFIKAPLNAQMLANNKKNITWSKHNFQPLLAKKREKIYQAQEQLEHEQRKEEDELLKKFQKERQRQLEILQKEVEEEWEARLRDLTERFDREFAGSKGRIRDKDRRAITLRFERDRKMLEESLKERANERKKYATLHLRKSEQEATSKMVQRHGTEMLNLLANMEQKIQHEVAEELANMAKVKRTESEMMQKSFEEAENTAMSLRDVRRVESTPPSSHHALQRQQRNNNNNRPKPIDLNIDLNETQRGDSFPQDLYSTPKTIGITREIADHVENEQLVGSSLLKSSNSIVRTQSEKEISEDLLKQAKLAGVVKPAISPKPPSCSKRDLFIDASVFHDLDNHVISIAENEHETFTELVHKLIEPCLTDLEKVRAIFRWITVKDLNVLDLEAAEGDTPLGLLRGIKYGTETYHVLFMRLCSYVGLHCVEIKGHSKSVGYEPGIRFEEDMFLNTWNSVLIDTDWRLIQCNWGARHLVLNKDKEKQRKENKNKVRYQYDEHYFLTDPDQFIQEFWPFEFQWQLLENPISLTQFEEQPFVRSVFFHYGMQLVDSPKAVVYTNEKGGAEIQLAFDSALENRLVFHYQLRFADKNKREDVQLERYAFQGIIKNRVVYSVYVPRVDEYLLEIFASYLSESAVRLTDPVQIQPFTLKCACKFKIICQKLSKKMHPLPECATGEWGPSKALRHFNMEALSHAESGVIAAENGVEIKFRTLDDLQFASKLRSNLYHDADLEKFVNICVVDEILTIRCKFPQPGQYGLDIYARPAKTMDETTLTHACKYLINVTKVDNPMHMTVIDKSRYNKNATKTVTSGEIVVRDKLGASTDFFRLGLRTLSHKEPKIFLEQPHCKIDIGLSESVYISYQFWMEISWDNFQDCVTMKAEENRKISFAINLPNTGSYLLAIFARKPDEDRNNTVNVFTYCIKYQEGELKNTGGKMSFFKKQLLK